MREQQSTYRTKSRKSVSQTPDRIRKGAKKGKVHGALPHINIDLLEEAFYELKENAAPGGDQLTWKDYEPRFDAQEHGKGSSFPSPSYRCTITVAAVVNALINKL
jgi:hypothetical protein